MYWKHLQMYWQVPANILESTCKCTGKYLIVYWKYLQAFRKASISALDWIGRCTDSSCQPIGNYIEVRS